MRTVIYERVSTAYQVDSESLPRQERDCLAHMERREGQLLEVIKDPGKSGKNRKRPEYRRLLEMAANGEVDLVISWKYDRFGRNLAEAFRALQAFKAYGVLLESATESSDVVARDYAFLNAAHESTRNAGRVRPMQEQKLEKGFWVGQCPLGYKIVRYTGPLPGRGMTLEPDSAATRVTEVFDLFATGEYSLRSLGLLKGISHKRLRGILRNPAYVGKVVYGRVNSVEDAEGDLHKVPQPEANWAVYDGLHPPLVTQEVFDRVQAMLDRNKVKGDPKPKRTRQLLTGLGWCACGSRLHVTRSGSRTKPGSENQYNRYYCRSRAQLGPKSSCRQPSVSAATANALVMAYVNDALSGYKSDLMWEGVLERLQQQHESKLDQEQLQRRSHEASRTRLQEALSGAAMKNATGVMADEAYKPLERGLLAQLQSIENELRDLPPLPKLPKYEAERRLAIEEIDWANLRAEDWLSVLEETVERVIITAGLPVVTLKPLYAAINDKVKEAREALIRI